MRNAAYVTFICSREEAPAVACMSLVSCMPALEHVKLVLPGLPVAYDLNCLLEALAWCPHLDVLILSMLDDEEGNAPFPGVPAFAKLRSLRVLHLALSAVERHALADVVDALVSLPGLLELEIELFEPAILPEGLGQLKGLRHLDFLGLRSCTCEAGCLDLPNLLSLDFGDCEFADMEMLLGHAALQSLRRIDFSNCQGHPFAIDLVALPRLQWMGFGTLEPCHSDAFRDLAGLPAATSLLSSSLLHLNFSGRGLAWFPLAVTQLVTLLRLDASGDEFMVLPAAITALSRVTELSLGRVYSRADPLQLRETHPLDARALGDLSAFPALCKLDFSYCEVILCGSALGAVRHARLQCLRFSRSHPAPACMQVVLQLSRALVRLGRGSVLQVCFNKDEHSAFQQALQDAQGHAAV